MPHGYSAHAVERNTAVAANGDINVAWKAACTAGALRVWEHGVAPAATNARMRALEWLPVASAVAESVNADAVEAKLKTMST